MLRTYTGGCHCTAVRFVAELDLDQGTGKCNCSYCGKLRLWTIKAKPEALKLTARDGALKEYVGRNQVAHHFFCGFCGAHAHDLIDVPNMSGARYVNINVACLDDVDAAELLAAPVRYFDGRNNAWEQIPEETRHL